MSQKTLNSEKTTDDFDSMIQIIFWNSMGFLFYMFVLAYITAEYFKVNGRVIGLIIAALPFGRMFITPLVGWLTDKVSKKKLILIGSFGRAAAYLTYYISIGLNSVVGFAIGVFFQGVLVGFFWPPLNTLISEKSATQYRTEAFGRRSGMSGYGSLVGAVISFSIFNLADLLGNNLVWIKFSPFLIFTTVNIYAGIRFYRKVDENNKYKQKLLNHHKKEFIAKPLTNKKENASKLLLFGIVILSLASMIASMNDHIARPFIQLYMSSESIITNETMIMLVMYIAQIFSQMLAPKIGIVADKINPLKGMIIISLLGALITFIIINISNPILFAIFLIIDFTLGISGFLFTQNIFSRISVDHRGKMFGLVDWMALIGWIIGPIWAGILWDQQGHKIPFYLTIGLELSLIPLFLIGASLLTNQFAEKIQSLEELHKDEPNIVI